MIRRLYIAACMVSLLLCLAAIWLDRRSARLYDLVEWDRAGNRQSIGAISAWRQVQLNYMPVIPPWLRSPQFVHEVEPLNPHGNAFLRVGWPTADIQAFGFRYQAGRFIGVPIYQFTASTRSLALAFAILPAIAAVAFTGRRLRALRRRRLHGLCHVCSYDLRANTGRCPECGTPIPLTMGCAAGPAGNGIQPQKTQETQKG